MGGHHPGDENLFMDVIHGSSRGVRTHLIFLLQPERHVRVIDAFGNLPPHSADTLAHLDRPWLDVSMPPGNGWG